MLLYIVCFYFGVCCVLLLFFCCCFCLVFRWGFLWGFLEGGGVFLFCLIYYNLLHYYVAFLCMYLFKSIILSVGCVFNPLHCYSV